VTPTLQRVLDSLPTPAYVKTPDWMLVAWNRAAVAVFGDYGALPPGDRNLLRRLFQPTAAAAQPDSESHRRFAVAAFRVDVARAGGSPEAAALVAELSETSADFRRLWAENELRSHGVAHKRIVRPGVGELAFESSAFSVDGSDGLSMVVFRPADDATARGIEQLIRALPA
jgi:hypothetical protein